MPIYDKNGSPISNPEINARDLILSSDFRKYFPMYYSLFASPLGLSNTKGKYLYIGGDSLHNYSGGDGETTDGFVTRYNKYLGMYITQDGYAGSTWSDLTGGGGIKRVTDLVESGTIYDVIILAWGTNDDPGGNGTIDDNASNESGCTMIAAMKWCITQLRTAFPKTAVGVIIPPPKNTNEGMKEKGDLMIQVCEQMHVPYTDMRRYLSIDDMGDDLVHLRYGVDKYGANEANFIIDICPYGDALRV